ncbi:Hexapeptide repeat of succinyl-transferase [Chishuiella changwenlii]|uniref:Glucose-1-phosphate thymidylyltransferase n=1 Tax=Chishuiella changwenlii TaxID=1434701 RepID=A0A1M6SS50_9FLAO|nr:LpxA family transferase [Chishuiella changwenlii]GGF07337.1 glucose-1-phosphate thymidylyltransferase [Chishuiella changwenlii]SHK47543.1 Hexapeptide repeat of succinyl-transferase [Chishuiella changwenlii]
MIDIQTYTKSFGNYFSESNHQNPWEVIDNLEEILSNKIKELSEDDYIITDRVAIHKSATVEKGVTFKGRIIISENCFIGAHAYLRGPIFLSNSVTIGPGSEIKQSIIFEKSAVAHFNYIGNSIIGEHVNFEAGSICANHYNERVDKNISVKVDDQIISTNTTKFGALVGDHSKVGANAVLSPGTILNQNSIVNRLELIQQIKS